jgi:sugar phosphate isomerase/epimerase
MNYGASLDLRMADSPEEFVQFLDDLGLSHVEIRQSYLDTRSPAPTVEELRALRESSGVSYTLHAPYNDCNAGAFHESLREAMVDSVVDTLETAAAIGASAVVVHGGSVRRGYPDHVHALARDQAVCTIRECARHAADVGVPLCVENSRVKDERRHFTARPTALAEFLDDVGVDAPALGVTLDVGHAKASGFEVTDFLDAVGDRVVVTHLHDNDGTADDHDPLPAYESVAALVGADYNVLEMKSRADVVACVTGDA